MITITGLCRFYWWDVGVWNSPIQFQMILIFVLIRILVPILMVGKPGCFTSAYALGSEIPICAESSWTLIVVLSITIINCSFRKNWTKKHRNSDWLGFPVFDSDWLNICLLFTLIGYDSLAMEQGLRRRIFINYTITLAQTDIEVSIKSHIMS